MQTLKTIAGGVLCAAAFLVIVEGLAFLADWHGIGAR